MIHYRHPVITTGSQSQSNMLPRTAPSTPTAVVGTKRKVNGGLTAKVSRRASIEDNIGHVPAQLSAVQAAEIEMSPEQFLYQLLRQRGYETRTMTALGCFYKRKPSPIELSSYDSELVQAVREKDLMKLQTLSDQGRSMSACNKFGESIMHIACRMSDPQLIGFLIACGARAQVCDDQGRTPLHDACWTSKPNFDAVKHLLNLDLRLLRVTDRRGSTPLAYIPRKQWKAWICFFDSMKETYWEPTVRAQSSNSGRTDQIRFRPGITHSLTPKPGTRRLNYAPDNGIINSVADITTMK